MNNRIGLAEGGPRRARTPIHVWRHARDYPPRVQLTVFTPTRAVFVLLKATSPYEVQVKTIVPHPVQLRDSTPMWPRMRFS
jgi:hypothetical protein